VSEFGLARWSAYADAVVDLELSGRTVTLGREGVVAGDPWTSAGSLYVITAYNPGREASSEENASAQARLLGLLAERGITWLPAVGRSRDASWREPSVALEVPEATAIAIADEFQQDAVFAWDGVCLRVIACHGGEN